ncbi:hypothetical protein VTH06DRAFT_706 [Thermothelomyces fergusii]
MPSRKLSGPFPIRSQVRLSRQQNPRGQLIMFPSPSPSSDTKQTYARKWKSNEERELVDLIPGYLALVVCLRLYW